MRICPRVAGVSALTTSWRMRRRPRPLRACFWSTGVQMPERICRIRIVFFSATGAAAFAEAAGAAAVVFGAPDGASALLRLLRRLLRNAGRRGDLRQEGVDVLLGALLFFGHHLVSATASGAALGDRSRDDRLGRRAGRAAAGLEDRLGQVEVPERVERRLHHVVRVRRPERLRQDVLDAHGLQDRADGAAGDDAGAFRGRLEEDPPRSVVPGDGVRDRLALQRDQDHGLLGHLDPLLDGRGDFLRLPGAVADAALAVTDDHERGEREVLAALDDLRDTVDVHDVVDQVGAGAALSEGPRGTLRSGVRTAGASARTARTVAEAGRTVRRCAAQNFNPFSRAESARALTLPW